jgi:hypothetical protein
MLDVDCGACKKIAEKHRIIESQNRLVWTKVNRLRQARSWRQAWVASHLVQSLGHDLARLAISSKTPAGR